MATIVAKYFLGGASMATAQNISSLSDIANERDRHVEITIRTSNTSTYNEKLTKLGLPTIDKVYIAIMSDLYEKDREYYCLICLSPTVSGKKILANAWTFESWINGKRDFDFAVDRIRVLDKDEVVFEKDYDKKKEIDVFLALADVKKEYNNLS